MTKAVVKQVGGNNMCGDLDALGQRGGRGGG